MEKNTVFDKFSGGDAADTFPRSFLADGVATTSPITYTDGSRARAIEGNVDTMFLSQFRPGDWVALFSGGNYEVREVASIASDRLMYVSEPFSNNHVDSEVRRVRPVFCFVNLVVVGDGSQTSVINIDGKDVFPNGDGLLDEPSNISMQYEKPADPRSAKRNLINPIVINPADGNSAYVIAAGTKY